MVLPNRFLRVDLLSVRSRDQLDPNYFKLLADTDGEGRRLQELR
jgi:hypothetical protein